MERITLYEEYRLIERTEAEVNGIWKGAHLLLFFLVFVFGSFCTFCFHMLMYLFDEKCVLFPKLLSITSLRQNIIYELIPGDKNAAEALPVDFLSTQWVEKSACLLPTYVPLVSGIFGLVWTTMFLMCSTGSRILTGLQRPWRVLPPVFLFSLAMGCLCVYTSAVTHYGLKELCLKLSEITGSTTCTYTVNVATLAYERRIRGVYQATRLTIYSAWLHTACWLLSALLALVRVILAIDFKLVRVTVHLQGNIDRMLEHHERHIRTITADALESNYQPSPTRFSNSAVRIHFQKKKFRSKYDAPKDLNSDIQPRKEDEEEGELLYYSNLAAEKSEYSLFSERYKLDQLKDISDMPDDQFMLKMLHNILDNMDFKSAPMTSSQSLMELKTSSKKEVPITRQYGQPRIESQLTREYYEPSKEPNLKDTLQDRLEAQEIVNEINKYILDRMNENIYREKRFPLILNPIEFISSLDIHSDFKLTLDEKRKREALKDEEEPEPSTSKGIKQQRLKSNLKRVGVQTDDKMMEKPTVHIDSKTSIFSSRKSMESIQILKENKETQRLANRRRVGLCFRFVLTRVIDVFNC